ncbi:MAG: hypothetical protein U0X39_07740 [Bacteroidales bacterium]
MNKLIYISLAFILVSCGHGSRLKEVVTNDIREEIITNTSGSGDQVILEAYRGKSFYYPLMAVWIEDQDGNYIQTLFVAKSVAKGIFRYGKQEGGKWVEAPKRAPQTLPYWAHKRGVQASDGLYMPEPSNPVADAYSGATPVTGFVLKSRTDKPLPQVFNVLMEINQNWDWNEYWTNDKYPGDENYKMSCQPALVYKAEIKNPGPGKTYRLSPVGHSHYSGKTGELFPDLGTLTTAMHIVDSVVVRVER